MSSKKLNVPLKEIVNHTGNVYEMTNATIKRASQLTVTGGATVEECEGKYVSAALKEVLLKKVSYQNDYR
jgi:DNA-directed RNA polymerase subunit omega